MPDTPKGQDNVEEKPQGEVTASEETQDLPEDTSERTREQFNKLKESNQQLKQRLDQLESQGKKDLDNVYESLRPKGDTGNVNDQDKVDYLESLVKDGYVDEHVLKDTLKELKKEASEAQQRARRAEARAQEIEENSQVREANKLYPQLDPKSKSFDPQFYRLVRNELVGQMIEGKKDLLAAAQSVSSVYKPNVEEAEKKEAKQQDFEKKEEQIQSQDVSSGARGERFSNAEADELVRATMRNEKGALAERLKRSGY